ncbi:MAG: SET domain-containing protein-lysine N-methyltransferase [Verrucomicrobia bacterium]|nr:SET domain-containing protein-lysine N-methyltransferase [Verrucomicrobiota bacterium]
MNWWFSKIALTPIYKPPTSAMKIRVEVDGVESLASPKELELLTGAKFAPWLEIQSERIHRAVCKLGAKLRRKQKMSLEQLWQGNYYKREIESGYMPDVLLRWTGEEVGWGLFARRAFRPKEFIAEYTGLLRRWRRADRKNAYCFEYVQESGHPTSYLIDARDQAGIARYINHSAKPNLKPTLATIGDVTHVILVVDRPIEKGEQLCYDYGPAYWSHRKEPIIFQG